MCKILMPINPCYVEKILSGSKKYEYRKIKARKKNVDTMVIYSTFPIMMIVAEVEIKEIIEENPNKVWNLTKKQSGITKEFYYKYYENRDSAIAYKLGKVKKYKYPKKLSDFGINYIPQSFVYLD